MVLGALVYIQNHHPSVLGHNFKFMTPNGAIWTFPEMEVLRCES